MKQTQPGIAVPSHPLALPDGAMNGGGLLGVGITLVVGFLALRKRWSRDNLELTKDRAETNLITAYQKTINDQQSTIQRLDENAREAWRTRAEDAKKIGELSAEVKHLTETNQAQNKKIENLTKVNVKLESKVDELTSLVRGMIASHPGNQPPSIPPFRYEPPTT